VERLDRVFWFGVPVACAIIVLSCYSYRLRLLDARLSEAEAKPDQVVDRGWSKLKARTEARVEVKRSDVERLEQAVLPPPVDVQTTVDLDVEVAGGVPDECMAVDFEDAGQLGVGGDRPVFDGDEAAPRGRRVTVGENCHGPPPVDGFTVLADCLTTLLAAEMHRRVPDSGPQAFRA